MKGWQIGSLGAVALGLFSGWYIASPWVTLYGIQTAAERRDVEALIGYVDFDALRANLKDQVHAMATTQPVKSTLPVGWSVPDRSTDLEAIDRQIDAFITPVTVRAMLADRGAPSPRVSGGVGDPAALARDVSIDREGLGQFVARAKSGSDGVGLVFTTRGLGWRISGIRLSPGMTEQGTRRLLGSSSF